MTNEPHDAPKSDTVSKAAEKAQAESTMKEVFPHVRVDRSARVVEFDGFVPIDAHHPDSPLVFLEVVACTVGTKEHEALVATEARPSNVHAALLLIGLKPGTPGSFRWKDKTLVTVPPTGDPVNLQIEYTDKAGKKITADPAAWIVNARTGQRIDEAIEAKHPGEHVGWVFAGSRFVKKAGREFYDADGAGTLIGLATFGSETIAFTAGFNPESAVAEPEWVARNGVVPPFGTPVVVRITPGS